MKKVAKLLYYCIINPVLKWLITPIFHRKYLQGKYFDISREGWSWVWRSLWTQKVFGFNRNVPWPVSPFIAIDDPKNIVFHPNDLNNFQHFGCYYSNYGGGKIFIGKGTWIAPNVGIITTNHDLSNPDVHFKPRDVVIGERCWLGMNSIILPGVCLGDNTTVGAGSVVTKSFPEGYCVIAGSPARKIKDVKKDEPL